jgi:hypothetical protein
MNRQLCRKTYVRLSFVQGGVSEPDSVTPDAFCLQPAAAIALIFQQIWPLIPVDAALDQHRPATYTPRT